MSGIAILGLGAMGQRMAANWLRAGHEVHAWNRSERPYPALAELGARCWSSPRDAVQEADFVVSMLRDDAASRNVWLDRPDSALSGLNASCVAIECSTLSLDWCGELAASMRARSLDFIDAPVVGSRPQAEAGQLIHLVGGPPQTIERARPILEVGSAAVIRAGNNGSAMAAKLAVNALFAIQVAALGELLGFLGKCGIEPERAADLLGQLPVASPAAKGAMAAMSANRHTPQFPAELAAKDLSYALDAALSRGAALPTTTAVHGLFAEACRLGFGGDNLSAVARLFD